ncbi:MAG: hypothetical protein MRY79_02855 [Alphaproteobacteria bacterium]|nr:hypothetical protein [Alphaproteobacteria bacterium]
MKWFFACLAVALLAMMPVSGAHAFYGERDSIYYMQDDGEFSEEEMDLEAMYVYEQCTYNALQKVYFNCECISGAFRQEREKVGPYVPLSKIYSDLFRDNERGCANTTEIAGDNYKSCMEYARIAWARERNNEEYCGCVANRVAKDFAKEPYLRTKYIENLRLEAMSHCRRTPLSSR